MSRLGSFLALILAAVVVALLAPAPALAIQLDPLVGRTAPKLDPAPPGINYMMDARSAPDLGLVQTWQANSPYDAIGVYIPVSTGLDSRSDKVQTNLTPDWVSAVQAGGWHVLPIYVGPQYACSTYTHTMSKNVATAGQQGLAAADDAANAVAALGIPMSSPVVYDLEGVSEHTANCTAAAQAFLAGWTSGLHHRGLNSGVYGSRDTTMTDIVAAAQDPGWTKPDVLWTATASGTPATSGYNPPPDGTWPGRRANQFNLGVDRSYAGDALNIDESAVDDTFWTLPSPDQTPPRIVAAAPAHVTKSGRVTLRWNARDDASGVAYYQVQTRHAVPGHTFRRWSALSKDVRTTSKRVTLRPGEQWCVRVVITDKAGNRTTPQTRCVARLADDRSLRAGRGWVRGHGRYLGTATAARRGGSVLRGPSVAGDLVAVAMHGPGSVVVAIGRHTIGTLHGNGLKTLRIPAAVSGRLSLRTTSRKLVAIDGYAVTVVS